MARVALCFSAGIWLRALCPYEVSIASAGILFLSLFIVYMVAHLWLQLRYAGLLALLLVLIAGYVHSGAKATRSPDHISKLPDIIDCYRAEIIQPPLKQESLCKATLRVREARTRDHWQRTDGKIILTILLLAVVGFGVYRWWDKIAPQSRPQNQSIDVARVKQEIERAKATPTDIPLLAGTNAATLVERSGIPAVTGISDYTKSTKDGKFVVQFPINDQKTSVIGKSVSRGMNDLIRYERNDLRMNFVRPFP